MCIRRSEGGALVVGVNSSYVHTSPAVYLLAELCEAEWLEFNINQHMGDVLARLYVARPKTAVFSCYIWNITYILRLVADLKKLLPDTIIVLGGPEVSFNAREIMEHHAFVDTVVCGEGESALPALLSHISGEGTLPDGVLWRGKAGIDGNESYNVCADISALPAPFSNYEYDDTRIYYYESSRGCPFSCAYCLSGDDVPLREKPLAQVFSDLESFTSRGVRLVKFTDRTFNANKERAKAILRHIAALETNACFHFEVALDIMDAELLDICAALPPGRVQLEAGVQSCNALTLAAVARSADISRVEQNARALLSAGNIHLHMDLIAGLPHEGIASFERSFDRIYSLYPHHLQLGFLKLLRGSRLQSMAGEYGIVCRDHPPYEVLYTADISADELFLLKDIDELLNRYYNTGRAREALCYLTKNGAVTPFEYFRSLREFCAARGLLARPVSAAAQFEILMEHGQAFLDEPRLSDFLRELKAGWINTKIKGRMPDCIREIQL